jgi:hypothetical protein
LVNNLAATLPLVSAWSHRYYNGHVNLKEMVGMVREPQNPYDRNAIRVRPTREKRDDNRQPSVC